MRGAFLMPESRPLRGAQLLPDALPGMHAGFPAPPPLPAPGTQWRPGMAVPEVLPATPRHQPRPPRDPGRSGLAIVQRPRRAPSRQPAKTAHAGGIRPFAQAVEGSILPVGHRLPTRLADCPTLPVCVRRLQATDSIPTGTCTGILISGQQTRPTDGPHIPSRAHARRSLPVCGQECRQNPHLTEIFIRHIALCLPAKLTCFEAANACRVALPIVAWPDMSLTRFAGSGLAFSRPPGDVSPAPG